MDDSTKKHIQPYKYHVLAGERIAIVNPSGAVYKLTKAQLQHKLSGEDVPLRDLSAHERIMLETAWAVLEGKAK